MQNPELECEIITLFPELFDSFLSASLLGKSIEAGRVAVHRTNPRDFAPGKHRTVDDTPYGGGPGMILQAGPVVDAIEHATAQRGKAHRILLSPQGRLFDQCCAARLAQQKRLLFICGRYEGIDHRVELLAVDEVMSIGDYVLSGGEIAAAVIIEAVSRLVPGVLGCGDSIADESHQDGRVEYPQFTRPIDFRGLKVPDVLMEGAHAKIARWRRQQSLLRTAALRPDLLLRHPPSREEQALLDEGGSDPR
jgi:tRNA (guanine37-N1)-methyltransferase